MGAPYEAYRERLAGDPEHRADVARLRHNGAAVAMENRFALYREAEAFLSE
jgi:hypothetical protein